MPEHAPLPLICTYCGAPLVVQIERLEHAAQFDDEGSMHHTEEECVLGFECERKTTCGAEWDERGRVRYVGRA